MKRLKSMIKNFVLAMIAIVSIVQGGSLSATVGIVNVDLGPCGFEQALDPKTGKCISMMEWMRQEGQRRQEKEIVN